MEEKQLILLVLTFVISFLAALVLALGFLLNREDRVDSLETAEHQRRPERRVT